MSTSSKATAPTAREVAASIKALGGRLTALVDKLAAAEKRDPHQPADGWPRDMAAGDASEPAWGRDPEGLRHA